MGEWFDIVDAQNQVVGRDTRDNAHRLGLWHRSCHVFVLSSSGLLLQQRSEGQDVCPSKWDLSVAEHLKAGEAYADAARRGLQEELGVTAQVEALGSPVQFETRVENPALIDREWQQNFVTMHAGPFTMQESEVHAIRWCALEQIELDVREQPQDFTPWMREHWSRVRGVLETRLEAL